MARTKEEKQKIVQSYLEGNSQDFIAKEFKIDKRTLKKILIDANVKIRTSSQTKGVDFNGDEIIEMYKNGMSAYEIQDFVKCKSVNTIYNYLREHCEIRNGRHGLDWNSNLKKDFFKEPMSEHAQYWLGFLYADGSIFIGDKRNPTIGLGLAEQDAYIISKLKEDLCLDNKITCVKKENAQNAYYLHFASKEIAEDLIQHGVIPRKTWEHTCFIGDEKTLTGHILRGFFDGDGWCSINKNKISAQVGFVGNWYTMNELKDILATKLGCDENKTIVCAGGKNAKTYWPRISYTRISDIVKLYDFMYKDATIYLTRKKEKFETFFYNRFKRNLITPWPSLLDNKRVINSEQIGEH